MAWGTSLKGLCTNMYVMQRGVRWPCYTASIGFQQAPSFVPPLVESGPVRRISGDGTSSYDFICFGSALVAVLPIFQTADHKQVLAWFAWPPCFRLRVCIDMWIDPVALRCPTRTWLCPPTRFEFRVAVSAYLKEKGHIYTRFSITGQE